MPLDTEKMVARLYRETRVPRRGLHPLRRLRAWWGRPRRPRRPIWPRLRRWARRHWLKLFVGGIACLVWAFIYIHWFNKLYNLECNVQASWASVGAEQERRHHIQLDLVRLVVGFVRHERAVMTDVTELRTEHLDSLSRAQMDELFPRIMLTAEQYPALRASENFQHFARALVDTENRVTDHIHAYNDDVNVYTTAIGQFPGNFFATIYGFESHDFYAPQPGTMTYRPVQYDPAAPTSGPAPQPPAAPAPSGNPIE